VNVDFGGSDYAYGAALQANGKIVVAGSSAPPGPSGLPVASVARLQPGGSLDTTFSGDGRQTVTAGVLSTLSGAALQANG
ncbi:delta-60 repeat domain-containing protein, partial [Enterobacter hormaechei]|uniref:delta-60 repeat domain-containing protein n=1 Tax=Enterobacter hormaechei TaxID=158836 RepID=UPI00402AB6A1